MSVFASPVLVIAPHLVHPAIMGSDIVIERMARYLSLEAPKVDLLASNAVREYRNGGLKSENSIKNYLRPRWQAALRTALHQSHYYKERFNTTLFTELVEERLATQSYGIIIASYITSLDLVPANVEAKLFIFTHNDEFKWFTDLAGSSALSVSGVVSRNSLKWLEREVPRLASRAVFIHLSKNDTVGFERVAPGHRYLLATAGTDVDDGRADAPTPSADRVIISFIGALGVKMALDALNHFHRSFEPALRSAFGPSLVVRVIGSNPSKAMRELCSAAIWELHENLSDADFSLKLRESTFTILPFAYSTGAKLKLVRSLGSGIPFLCTTVAQPVGFSAPPGCCFSDLPEDWVAAVRRWREEKDKTLARSQLLAVAEKFSWPVVVRELAGSLRQF